jgi:3-hydroxy-9,10-secoandrosta-1,3,5(10)-triene-9,17-dione monooxygenase
MPQTREATPESDLARELVDRARSLAPLLAAHASETDSLGHVPDSVLAALAGADLLALGPPSVQGAHPVDIDTMFEVAYQLGRGCMSTAWCWQEWTLHAWLTGYLTDEGAREEIFAGGPSTIISGALVPKGVFAEPVEGGYMLRGHWAYSSGVDHADWLVLDANVAAAHSPLEALPKKMFVPRELVTVTDDWDPFGLKGTGSKSLTIRAPVYVPDTHIVDLSGAAEGRAGARYGRFSYALPSEVATGFVVGAPFIGAAQAMVDDFCTVAAQPDDSFDLEETAAKPSVHLRVGRAAADVYGALQMSRAVTREMLEHARRGESLFPEQRARYRLAQGCNIQLSHETAREVFEITGRDALSPRSAIARRLDDIAAGSRYLAFNWDELTELYARVRLTAAPESVIPETALR